MSTAYPMPGNIAKPATFPHSPTTDTNQDGDSASDAEEYTADTNPTTAKAVTGISATNHFYRIKAEPPLKLPIPMLKTTKINLHKTKITQDKIIQL